MDEKYNEKYDVKGRLQRLEQRKIWNIGLEHLRKFHSFDVEFSSSGQVLQETKYNMAGAAIGSEHFAYDDSGKACRLLELDSAGRQIRSVDFVRQTEGNRIITISEVEGKFIGRTVGTYDGELLLSFATYDAKNLLMREKIFQYSDKKVQTSDSGYYIPDGPLVERFLSSYDSEGRLTETYESVEKSGQRQKLVLWRGSSSALLMLSRNLGRRKTILPRNAHGMLSSGVCF